MDISQPIITPIEHRLYNRLRKYAYERNITLVTENEFSCAYDSVTTLVETYDAHNRDLLRAICWEENIPTSEFADYLHAIASNSRLFHEHASNLYRTLLNFRVFDK